MQLISSTGFYGAEAVVCALARGLPEFGIDVSVAHIRYTGDGDTFRFERHASDIDVIPIEHRHRIDRTLSAHLKDAILRVSPDLIHCHGYKPDLYGLRLARSLDLPIISTCHLWTRSTAALRIYAKLDARVLRQFNSVVAVSLPIRQELIASGISDKNIHFIPNGVATERFSSATPSLRNLFPANAVVFGMACRQVHAKGVDVMLHAMALLSGMEERIHILIIGDGPRLRHYKRMAEDLGVVSRVIFAGRQEDMPSVFASMDVFLLPSRDEGLPIALLEAMASGLPVIATPVGSVPEVFRGRDIGYLIPQENPAALAEAMLQLARNPWLRKTMGLHAQNVVKEEYSEERMVRAYAELYRRTLLAERAA
ncbi:MAG: glycosyltransferase family 4 protein [Acidobacteriaceae bacterium]